MVCGAIGLQRRAKRGQCLHGFQLWQLRRYDAFVAVPRLWCLNVWHSFPEVLVGAPEQLPTAVGNTNSLSADERDLGPLNAQLVSSACDARRRCADTSCPSSGARLQWGPSDGFPKSTQQGLSREYFPRGSRHSIITELGPQSHVIHVFPALIPE